MPLANDSRRAPILRGCLAALALLAATGCASSVKPLPPSPTTSTAAGGNVVPASFIQRDGTNVSGPCSAG